MKKTLVHNYNKQGVKGEKKIKKSLNVEGGKKIKINKCVSMFIREMRVLNKMKVKYIYLLVLEFAEVSKHFKIKKVIMQIVCV